MTESELHELLFSAGRGGKRLCHQFFRDVGEELILLSKEEVLVRFLDWYSEGKDESDDS